MLTAAWLLLLAKKRELQSRRRALGLRPGQREEEALGAAAREATRPWPWRPRWLRVVHVTDAQTVLLSPLVYAWALVAAGGYESADERWGEWVRSAGWTHAEMVALVGAGIAAIVVPQTVAFTVWDAKPEWAPAAVREAKIDKAHTYRVADALVFAGTWFGLSAAPLVPLVAAAVWMPTDERVVAAKAFLSNALQTMFPLPDHLPSVAMVAYESFGLYWVWECAYYVMHSWLHTPTVYRLVHKVHHRAKSPYALAAFVAHPLEVWLSFLNPACVMHVVPQSFPMNLLVVPCFYALQVQEHVGYEFEWLEREDFHWQHHAQTVKNIGLSGIVDDWFGTTYRGDARVIKALSVEPVAAPKNE